LQVRVSNIERLVALKKFSLADACETLGVSMEQYLEEKKTLEKKEPS
jgi:hypothetical protein